MPAKLLAHVAVKAKMVEEIMPLKNAMILHNPKNFFRHKWFQYRRSYVGMVGGAQRIAHRLGRTLAHSRRLGRPRLARPNQRSARQGDTARQCRPTPQPNATHVKSFPSSRRETVARFGAKRNVQDSFINLYFIY